MPIDYDKLNDEDEIDYSELDPNLGKYLTSVSKRQEKGLDKVKRARLYQYLQQSIGDVGEAARTYGRPQEYKPQFQPGGDVEQSAKDELMKLDYKNNTSNKVIDYLKAKEQAKANAELWGNKLGAQKEIAQEKNLTAKDLANIAGAFGMSKQGLANQGSANVAGINADAKRDVADKKKESGRPMTSTDSKLLSGLKSAEADIDELDKAWEAAKAGSSIKSEGFLAGYGQDARGMVRGTPEYQYNLAKPLLSKKLAKINEGGRLTDFDQASFDKTMPAIGLSRAEKDKQISLMKTMLRRSYNSMLQGLSDSDYDTSKWQPKDEEGETTVSETTPSKFHIMRPPATPSNPNPKPRKISDADYEKAKSKGYVDAK